MNFSDYIIEHNDEANFLENPSRYIEEHFQSSSKTLEEYICNELCADLNDILDNKVKEIYDENNNILNDCWMDSF